MKTGTSIKSASVDLRKPGYESLLAAIFEQAAIDLRNATMKKEFSAHERSVYDECCQFFDRMDKKQLKEMIILSAQEFKDRAVKAEPFYTDEIAAFTCPICGHKAIIHATRYKRKGVNANAVMRADCGWHEPNGATSTSCHTSYMIVDNRLYNEEKRGAPTGWERAGYNRKTIDIYSLKRFKQKKRD